MATGFKPRLTDSRVPTLCSWCCCLCSFYFLSPFSPSLSFFSISERVDRHQGLFPVLIRVSPISERLAAPDPSQTLTVLFSVPLLSPFTGSVVLCNYVLIRDLISSMDCES